MHIDTLQCVGISSGAILEDEESEKSDTQPVLRDHSLTHRTISTYPATQSSGKASSVESILTTRDGIDGSERDPIVASLQCDQVTSRINPAYLGEWSEGPEPPTRGAVVGSSMSGVIEADVVGTVLTTDQVDTGPLVALPHKHSQNVRHVTALPPSLAEPRVRAHKEYYYP